MNPEEPSVGPLQLLLVGFETTERFRGEIARELIELRGRGMIRVLDARLLSRRPDGEPVAIDLGPLLGEAPAEPANPLERLFFNGIAGNGGARAGEALARTAGFALADLRRLTDELDPGDLAAAVLIEHLWAARLRTAVHNTGGRLVAQGFLTPEVVMLVGSEIQARADAQAAIELADAARGSALMDALAIVSERRRGSPEDAARAATEVVRVLVARGYVPAAEAHGAIDALVTAGLIEAAVLEAAVAEAEQFVDREDDR